MDINERVDRIETKIENLENKFNDSIPEIQSGIREIKVMLQERPIQENLKNNIIEKEIQVLESKYEQKVNSLQERIKKAEDNQVWLRRTVIAGLIGLVIEVIVFVVKMMQWGFIPHFLLQNKNMYVIIKLRG